MKGKGEAKHRCTKCGRKSRPLHKRKGIVLCRSCRSGSPLEWDT